MSPKPRVLAFNTPHPHPRAHPHPHTHGHPHPRQPIDIRRTREYKTAARRWTSTIVALPIFLVTSYVLWDRTYGDKKTERSGVRND
ncbi:uncharacterized protein EURHEDRAFT_407748 [Aspergillus ruber CBS 135680]|uniref:Uncharacterized protein n=1 Tax=Aspergillus ruber (strain CBS 135680) TaxID=1388766 RepID=A0A017SSH7_ASPRC|nr:uncharacterized protein EURHEDRAFT_407748 [Aspergillus ruber CBS 135680]EYE99751.1 hypothetical protein EURHEDRAFT_407748 [Aspergillus ruber CBS 135680]